MALPAVSSDVKLGGDVEAAVVLLMELNTGLTAVEAARAPARLAKDTDPGDVVAAAAAVDDDVPG